MGAAGSSTSLLDDPKSEQPLSAQPSLVPQDNLVLQNADFTPQADSEYEMTSSIRLKKILGFAKATFAKQTKSEAPNVTSATPQFLNIKPAKATYQRASQWMKKYWIC